MKLLRAFCTSRIPRTLVLCYHRVADVPRDPFDCCVSPRNFSEQLNVLRDMDVVRPFEDFIEAYRPRRTPGSRTVIITFDDGYADNLHCAAQLLSEHNFHAIFYIFTSWIERTQEAWWDRLERLVFSFSHLPPVLKFRGIESQFVTADRLALLKALHIPVRSASEACREQILATIGGAMFSREVRSTHRPLTLKELGQLAAIPGMHIGAHTRTHVFLPSLAIREQHLEIASSREWLESCLGRPVRDFSYPHGGETAETRIAAAAAGMRTAVTSEARPAFKTDSPLAIPRIPVHNWNGNEFARRLEWWFNQ